MKDYYQIEALSRSKLLRFKRSAYAGINTPAQEDTSAMVFGRAFHAYMEDETGQQFYSNYYVMPDDSSICQEIGGKVPRNTNKYKDWKAEQEIIANGRTVLSLEDFNRISTMAANIRNSKMYKTLFSGKYPVQNETTGLAEIEGIQMKALADRLVERKNDVLIVDWKTTSEQLTDNPFHITRIIKKWDLHVQNWHYQKVFEKYLKREVMFMFFFVETKEPFEVLPVIIDPNSELIAEGAEIWQNCLVNYKKAKAGLTDTLADSLTDNIMIL